jgi:hypothetical protein
MVGGPTAAVGGHFSLSEAGFIRCYHEVRDCPSKIAREYQPQISEFLVAHAIVNASLSAMIAASFNLAIVLLIASQTWRFFPCLVPSAHAGFRTIADFATSRVANL